MTPTADIPLEFMRSVDLADEIRDRSDVCVLFWARTTPKAEGMAIDGECRWRMSKSLYLPVMEAIAERIAQSLSDREEQP